MLRIDLDELKLNDVINKCKEIDKEYKDLFNNNLLDKPGSAGEKRYTDFVKLYKSFNSTNTTFTGCDALLKLYKFYLEQKQTNKFIVLIKGDEQTSRLAQFIALGIANLLKMNVSFNTYDEWKTIRSNMENMIHPLYAAKYLRTSTSPDKALSIWGKTTRLDDDNNPNTATEMSCFPSRH